MAFLWFLIVVLAGTVIGLVIYITEKPKAMQKEIDRLRKSMILEAKNFEQLEYRIETLKNNIFEKRKIAEKEGIKNRDFISYLEDLEKQLDKILNQLLSENAAKQ